MQGRAIAVIVFILMTVTCSFVTSYSQNLTIWIMPNEPSLEEVSDAAIIDFWEQNCVFLEHTQQELLSDHSLAAQVLGQRQILKEVAEYVGNEQAEGSDIGVRIRVIPWVDALEEILSISAHGPDIVQLGSTWTPYVASKGLLADLTDAVNPTDYFKSSIASCRRTESDTRIWAVPWFVDARLLYYWRDILRTAGVHDPPADLQDWIGFRHACNRVQDLIGNGGASTFESAFAIPVKRNRDLLHEFAIWAWAGGGDILRKGRAVFHEKNTVEAMDFLRTLKHDGCLSLPETDLEDIERGFLNRRYAMIIGRVRSTEGFEQLQENIGFALPPVSSSAKRTTFVGGSNLAILKSSREFEQALRLVEFLNGTSNFGALVSYTRAIGMPPARQGAISLHFGSNAIAQEFQDALNHGRSYPSVPEWVEVEERVPSYFYLIWKDINNEEPLIKIQGRLEVMAAQLDIDLRCWWLKDMLSQDGWHTVLAKIWSWILKPVLRPIYALLAVVGGTAASVIAIVTIVKWIMYLVRHVRRRFLRPPPCVQPTNSPTR